MGADAQPLGASDRDWNWPISEYPIQSNWESGAYIARGLDAGMGGGEVGLRSEQGLIEQFVAQAADERLG
jgi:hypothetical protein